MPPDPMRARISNEPRRVPGANGMPVSEKDYRCARMRRAVGRERSPSMPAWTRREMFGFSALAALASTLRFETVARAAAAKAAKATYVDNIYTRMFGVRPVIGAFEPLSRYGNSFMAPEVID